MNKKPKCRCCKVLIGDTVVHHEGETVFVSEWCWNAWQRKPNGPRRMLQVVRAQEALAGTREHDLALLRLYIEGNYNEYGGDEELAALDRIESAFDDSVVRKIIAEVAAAKDCPVDILMGPGHRFEEEKPPTPQASRYQPDLEPECPE